MNEYLPAWIPPVSMTNHGGGPLPEDVNFFAAPPMEIGKILSAYSSMKVGAKPPTQLKKVVYSVLEGAIGFAGIFLLTYVRQHWSLPASIAASVVGLFVGLLIGSPPNSTWACSYIGEKGVAEYDSPDKPRQEPRSKSFVYADAAELRTKLTDKLGNTGYLSTTFRFEWTNAQGTTVYNINGWYSDKAHNPSSDSHYHFARGAEDAWTRHYIPAVRELFTKTGAVRFSVLREGYIEVGRDYIEVRRGAEVNRVAVEDLDDIEIKEGWLRFKQEGSKEGFLGVGRTGIFSFTYGDVANARVLLLLLQDLVSSRPTISR